MLKLPYTYLLILLISHLSYQTIWFGILCAVLTSLVMWIVYRWRLRKVARAIRIARELCDTMLQTVQGSKFVVDDAMERPNDTARMRDAMKKVSNWLGQATQEGQKVLNLLSTANVEKHAD